MKFRNQLEKYKYDNNYKTSEKAFYVNEQPGDTCPMIDQILNILNSALSEMENLEKKEHYDLYCVIRDLQDIEEYAEKARENAKRIREWGQNWKDISKRYFELDPSKIDELL